MLLFISGGVGPHSLLVHGGVGPSLLFMPGAVGPSLSFGLGPSFTVCGAGGSSSCMDGAAGGSSFFMGGGAGGSSYCLWVVVVCPHLTISGWWSSHVILIMCPHRHCVSSPCHCLMPSLSLSHVAVIAVPSLLCIIWLHNVAPVLEILGGGGELTHLGSSLPVSVCGCWSSFTTHGGWSYVGGRLRLWVAGFVFWAVVVAVWSLVVIGICGRSRGWWW